MQGSNTIQNGVRENVFVTLQNHASGNTNQNQTRVHGSNQGMIDTHLQGRNQHGPLHSFGSTSASESQPYQFSRHNSIQDPLQHSIQNVPANSHSIHSQPGQLSHFQPTTHPSMHSSSNLSFHSSTLPHSLQSSQGLHSRHPFHNSQFNASCATMEETTCTSSKETNISECESNLEYLLKKFASITLKLPAIKSQINLLLKEVENNAKSLYQLSSEAINKNVNYLGPHPQDSRIMIPKTWTYTVVVPRMIQNPASKDLLIAYLESIRSLEKNCLWGNVYELNLAWGKLAWYILDLVMGSDDKNRMLIEEIFKLAKSVRLVNINGKPSIVIANILHLQPIFEFKSSDDKNEMVVLKNLILWLGIQLVNSELSTSGTEKNPSSTQNFNLLFEDESSTNQPFMNEDVYKIAEERGKIIEKIFHTLEEYHATQYGSSLFQPNANDIIHGNLLRKVLAGGYFSDEDALLSILQQFPISSLGQEGVSEDEVMNSILVPTCQYLNDTPVTEYPKIAFHILAYSHAISEQYPTYNILKYIIFSIFPKLKFIAPIALMRFPFKKMIEEHEYSLEIYKDFFEQIFQEIFDIQDSNYLEWNSDERLSHMNSFVNRVLFSEQPTFINTLNSVQSLKQISKGRSFNIIGVLRELINIIYLLYNKEVEVSVKKQLYATFEFFTNTLLDFTYCTFATIKSNVGLLTKLRLEAIEDLKVVANTISEVIPIITTFIRMNLQTFKQNQPWIISEFHNLLRFQLSKGFKRLHITSALLREIFLFIHSNDRNESLRSDKEQFGYDILLSLNWSNQTIEERKMALKVLFLTNGSNSNVFEKFLIENFYASNSCKDLCAVEECDANLSITELFTKYCLPDPSNQVISLGGNIISCFILISYFEVRQSKNEILNINQVELFLESEVNEVTDKLSNRNQEIIDNILLRIKSIVANQPKIGMFLFQQLVSKLSITDTLSTFDSSEAGSILSLCLNNPDNLKQLESLLLIDSEEVKVWFALLASLTGFQSLKSRYLVENVCRLRTARGKSKEPIVQAFRQRWLSSDEITKYLVETDGIWTTICMIHAYPKTLPSLIVDSSSHYGRTVLNTKDECSLWIAADCAERISKKMETKIRLTLCIPLWFQFFEFLHITQEYHGVDAPMFPDYLQVRYNKIFDEGASTLRGEIGNVFNVFMSWELNEILSFRSNIEELLANSNFIIQLPRKDISTPVANQVPPPTQELLSASASQNSPQHIASHTISNSSHKEGEIVKFHDSIQSAPIIDFQSQDIEEYTEDESLLQEPKSSSNPFIEYIEIYHKQKDILIAIKESTNLGTTSQATLIADRFSRDIEELFENFVKFTLMESELDQDLIKIYDSIYETSETQAQIVVTAEGIQIPTSFSRPVSKLADPNVASKLAENRKQSKKVSDEISRVLEALSVQYLLLERLLSQPECIDTLIHIYFSLIPTLLNRSSPTRLVQIWKSFVQIISKIGETVIFGRKDLQPMLLQQLLGIPRGSFVDVKEQNVLPNLRPGAPIPRVYSYSYGLSDFDPLFSGFNPSILITDSIIDYMVLLTELFENCDNLSHHDFSIITEKFRIDSLFDWFCQKPLGERLNSCNEADAVISIMKRSLSNSKHKLLGDVMLKNAFRITFPVETGFILHIVLQQHSNFTFSDRQWSYYITEEMIKDVHPSMLLGWVQIINEYICNVNTSGLVACATLLETIITRSSLRSLLRLANAQDKDSFDCILFFANCFRNSNEAIRTESMSITDFTQVLTSFKNIITSLPMLTDHVFKIFTSNMLPYALSQGQQHLIELKKLISSIDFSLSTFHEQDSAILDQMWEMLPNDQESILLIFSKLQFNNILHDKRKYMKCHLLRLYFDVNLVNQHAIPQSLRTSMGESSLDMPEVWEGITESEFGSAFDGHTTSRLLMKGVLGPHSSFALMENLYLIYNIAQAINNPNVALICCREIVNTSTLIIRKRGNYHAAWYLSTKKIVEIAQRMVFPLAMKFANIELITECFNFVSKLENGVEPILLLKDIPFAMNVAPCAFEKSPELPLLEEHKLLMMKIFGIAEQLHQTASLFFCRVCISIVPSLSLPLSVKLRLLEGILRSYLDQSNDEQSRENASTLISFGTEDFPSSPQFQNIIGICCQQSYALILTVLLHKLLYTAIRNSAQLYDKTNVFVAYVQCMTAVINFVPDRVKNYELIYLYLFVLEMMETNYWDFNNSSLRPLVNDFLQILYHLGSAFSFTIRRYSVPDQYKDLEISPQMSLAAVAFESYIERLQQFGRSNISDDGSLLRSYHNTISLSGTKKLFGRRSKSAFRSFSEFFEAAQNLNNLHLTLFEFRGTIHHLFPLSDYLFKL